jgi:ABC-type branched-subunit amino acid transport system ATPase component
MSQTLLQIRKLTNFFGMVCTAKELDLDVEAGVLTSIIGPNGAGKSTLINLITGNLPVQSGAILFKGRDISRLPIHQRVRLGICRSFQIVNIFPELTVLENLLIPTLALSGRTRKFFAEVRGERAAREQVEHLLDKVGLAGVKDTAAKVLSHGDQRLLEVGVALAVKPTQIGRAHV